MEPVYREIGYCSDVGTLWRKLKSNQCDWLGIDEKGDYRLGYPKRRSGVEDSLLVTQYNAKDVVLGAHTVRIYDAPWQGSENNPFRNSLYDDEASAIAAFYQFVEEVRTSPNYRLAKVQRVEEGIVVQEWFGVAGHREEWYPEAP
jgi:hypothetical protein